MTSKQSIKTKSFYLLVYNIVHPPKTHPPHQKKNQQHKKNTFTTTKSQCQLHNLLSFPKHLSHSINQTTFGYIRWKERERGGQGTCDGLICFCIGQGREERINTSNTQPFNFSSYLF